MSVCVRAICGYWAAPPASRGRKWWTVWSSRAPILLQNWCEHCGGPRAPPGSRALRCALPSSWSTHNRTPWEKSPASPSSRLAFEHWAGPEWASEQTPGAGCDCTPKLRPARDSERCRNQFYCVSAAHCCCCSLRACDVRDDLTSCGSLGRHAGYGRRWLGVG